MSRFFEYTRTLPFFRFQPIVFCIIHKTLEQTNRDFRIAQPEII